MTRLKNYSSLFKCLLLTLGMAVLSQPVFSQSGFQIINKGDFGELPFDYVNGFIIVSVVYNHTFPLKFIFDTGASNTIIHNKDIVNLFDPDYGRTFTVYGADLQQPMYAHLVKSIHLKTQNLVAPQQHILVLEDDYFSFKKLTGIEIHGIIGADMFRNYKVAIDYQRRVIRLHKHDSKKLKTKGYQEIPMVIQKSKPYIVCPITLSNQDQIPLKLLVDTGASTALLLNIDSDTSLILPQEIIPENLGFGIGGVMKGYVGRIPYLNMGGKELENIVCHFQKSENTSDSLSLIFRNGLIGNYILDRFDLIINYHEQKFYIKPSRKWKRKFEYDKSGIGFISVGIEKSKYYIQSILKESPADKAGLKSGDIILKINHKPATFLSYDTINRILRGKTEKKVRLKVKRGEESLKFEFRLKELI